MMPSGASRLVERPDAGVDVSVPVGDLAEVLEIRVPGAGLAEVRRQVLETTARLVQAERALLFAPDAAGQWQLALAFDPSPASAGLPSERREAVVVRAARDGRVVFAEATRDATAGHGRAAAVPLALPRRLVGVLYVEGEGMPRTEREACLLALLADRLLAAELHHATEGPADGVTGLAAPALAAIRGDGAEARAALCDLARAVLGADAAILMAADGKDGRAAIAAASGRRAAEIGPWSGDSTAAPPSDLLHRLGFRHARAIAVPGPGEATAAALHLLYGAPSAPSALDPLVAAVAAAVLEIGRAREEARTSEQLGRTEKTRALGVLAGGVSHEFNNLLAIILGKTQLALQRGEPGDLRGDLAIIEQTAWRAADTVRRLQTFVAGRSDERVTAIEVDRLVRDVLTFTEPIWKDDGETPGARIEVRTQLGTATTVMGRVGELQEALTNLIRNAVDAMPNGGRITVATHSRGGVAEISVTDTGEGISPDDRTRIFDPFFTTRSPLRAGLGLSVVQGIAARHGGRIDVRTQPGRGTTLTLALPEISPEAAVEAEATAPPRPRGGAVLVIEDEHHLRRLLLDTLYAAGHEVEGAADGLDGLRRFAAGQHDLVITDLTMPGCSGLEVARAVKGQRPGTPVLMITGWGDLLDLDGMRERQVDLVLVKPFTMERVLGAVAESLAQRRPRA